MRDELGDRRRTLAPLLCIWASFLLYSFIHAPIPGVNEPQYLGKAKHYWNPDWCPGDFFLESSNPHLVFYQTFGLLTRVLTLEQTAVVGRVVAYFVLALGWHGLCTLMTRDRWCGLTAAWVFLCLAGIGNFSGEWLVGGVEGKVLTYGFVLLSLTAFIGQRWGVSGLSAGLAVAFHPLVGIWSLIAIGLTALATILLPGHIGTRNENFKKLKSSVLSTQGLIGMALLVGVSLTGVVPALAAVSGSTPELNRYGNYVQVFYRLAHHLDPMQFTARAYQLYVVLSFVGWIVFKLHARNAVWTLLARYVMAAGIIALAGVVIGAGPRPPQEMSMWEFRMGLLKYYPFRLFDVVLPVFVSFLVAGVFSSDRLTSVLVPARWRWSLFAAASMTGLFLNAGFGSINRMATQQERDWLAACQWLRENTAEDALVYSPKDGWAFKWFAQRPEYVSRKDCPQDAAGIREWNERLNGIRDWGEDYLLPQGGYSREDTHRLSEETGITYIVSRRFGPFDVPVVFESETYRIYRIAAD